MHTHTLEAIPKSRAFRIEVCESLSRSPLFKDWSWEELDTLSSHMAGYRAKAGDLLFEEGDDGLHVFGSPDEGQAAFSR